MSEEAHPITVEALLAEQDWLRALARRLVRDEGRADDLLQDVWLKVISAPPRTVRSVRAWLTRVLVNRHRDVARSEGARADREDSAARRTDSPSTAELVARVDAQQRVAAAVLALEEPIRETVLLRFFEDLSVREVARRMGVPYETARARLTKGLDLLRARLAPKDGRGERRWSAGLLALAGAGSTGGTAAAAALTGVVIAMKKKLAAVAAVLVLLAVGIGGYSLLTSKSGPTAPDPMPEEVAVVPTGKTVVEKPAEEAPEAGVPQAHESTPEEKLDPRRGSCHGTITLPDGTPAAGLKVRLSGRPAKVVTTDAEGRFRIVNEWVDSLGRSLYVGERNGLLALGNVPLRVGEDVEFDARIPGGKPIAVEVVSAEDGRPLAGVWVNFYPLSEDHYPSALCITDEDGKGALDWLPPRDFRVYIASSGYRPHAQRLDVTSRPAPEVLRIALHDPEEFRLTVSPPPPGKKQNVYVAFLPVPDDPVKGQHSVLLTLDAEGKATGIAPAPGRYRAHVDVYGVVRRMIEDIEVREREPLSLTVEIETGVEVRGVLRGPDGKPIRGRVTLDPKDRSSGSTEKQGTANERGEFRIVGVPPGRCWVNVEIGRQTLHGIVPDVEIGESGRTDLEIRIPAGGSLSGRITGSERPNAHFVNLYGQTENGWTIVASAYPDGRGRFAMRYVPVGRHFVVVNPHRPEEGWAKPIPIEVRKGEAADPIEVKWRSCPRIDVTVTAADGAPVGGKLQVQALPRRTGDGSPDGGLYRYFSTTLDATGRGVLKGLAPGRFQVHFTHGTGREAKSVAVEIDVKEADNPALSVRLPE